MTKKLITKEAKPLTAEAKVLEDARNIFSTMQRNWWEFAKIIYEIREGETYKHEGHETFKDYCEHEFSQTNFKTIIKYCSIVENWGKSIQSKIEKDPSYQLPAYESCYTVISIKDGSASKEQIDKLKRDVLEKKTSYHRLKDKMKEILESARKETRSEIIKGESDIKRMESQLESQIEDDEIDDTAFTEDDSYIENEDNIDVPEVDLEDINDEDFEDENDAIIAKAHKAGKDLSEFLTILNDKFSQAELTYTKGMKNLAVLIQNLNSSGEEFLNNVEEISA